MPTIKKTPRLSASREKSFAHFPLSIVPSQSGFTLIEVLITIAILAVVAYFALPSFHNFNKNQGYLNSVSDLMATLRVAQSNAQDGVVCGTSAASYWAVGIIDSSHYALTCSTTSADPVTWPQQKQLIQGLSFSSPPTPSSSCYIKFQGSTITASPGCKDSDSPLVIPITKNGSACFSVTIQSGGAISEIAC